MVFINSLNKYLLNAYYALGTILGILKEFRKDDMIELDPVSQWSVFSNVLIYKKVTVTGNIHKISLWGITS